MRTTFVVMLAGSLFALGCGGVKGIEKSGTSLGNDIADSSVTKDVAGAGNSVGNEVAPKDAGATPAATPKKKKPGKKAGKKP